MMQDEHEPALDPPALALAPLPAEVFAQVLTYVPHNNLVACAYVNGSWAAAALPLLYRHLRLRGNTSRWPLFATRWSHTDAVRMVDVHEHAHIPGYLPPDCNTESPLLKLSLPPLPHSPPLLPPLPNVRTVRYMPGSCLTRGHNSGPTTLCPALKDSGLEYAPTVVMHSAELHRLAHGLVSQQPHLGHYVKVLTHNAHNASFQRHNRRRRMPGDHAWFLHTLPDPPRTARTRADRITIIFFYAIGGWKEGWAIAAQSLMFLAPRLRAEGGTTKLTVVGAEFLIKEHVKNADADALEQAAAAVDQFHLFAPPGELPTTPPVVPPSVEEALGELPPDSLRVMTRDEWLASGEWSEILTLKEVRQWYRLQQ
jgi:hypothetical protein